MGMKVGNSKKGKGADKSDDEEDDEEEDDLIARRNAYVKKSIREAQAAGLLKSVLSGAKNPLAMEKRRDLIKDFFKDVVAAKKCASCSGYVSCDIQTHFPFAH
jgi:DNA-directed RNA polymerase I subunit RPA1